MDTFNPGSLCLAKRCYNAKRIVWEPARVVGTFTQDGTDFSRTLVKFVSDDVVSGVSSNDVKTFDIDVVRKKLKNLEQEEATIKKEIDALKNLIQYYGVYDDDLGL